MTELQERVVSIMRKHREVDLYELGGKDGRGTGEFTLTNAHLKASERLSVEEVAELVSRSLIVERWAGCYAATQAKALVRAIDQARATGGEAR